MEFLKIAVYLILCIIFSLLVKYCCSLMPEEIRFSNTLGLKSDNSATEEDFAKMYTIQKQYESILKSINYERKNWILIFSPFWFGVVVYYYLFGRFDYLSWKSFILGIIVLVIVIIVYKIPLFDSNAISDYDTNKYQYIYEKKYVYRSKECYNKIIHDIGTNIENIGKFMFLYYLQIFIVIIVLVVDFTLKCK